MTNDDLAVKYEGIGKWGLSSGTTIRPNGEKEERYVNPDTGKPEPQTIIYGAEPGYTQKEAVEYKRQLVDYNQKIKTQNILLGGKGDNTSKTSPSQEANALPSTESRILIVNPYEQKSQAIKYEQLGQRIIGDRTLAEERLMQLYPDATNPQEAMQQLEEGTIKGERRYTVPAKIISPLYTKEAPDFIVQETPIKQKTNQEIPGGIGGIFTRFANFNERIFKNRNIEPGAELLAFIPGTSLAIKKSSELGLINPEKYKDVRGEVLNFGSYIIPTYGEVRILGDIGSSVEQKKYGQALTISALGYIGKAITSEPFLKFVKEEYGPAFKKDFWLPTKPSQDFNTVFYHGTQVNPNIILKEGLKPGDLRGGLWNKGDVFLSSNIDLAKKYAGEQGSVFRVQLNQKDFSSGKVTNYGPSNLFNVESDVIGYSGIIKPRKITRVDNFNSLFKVNSGNAFYPSQNSLIEQRPGIQTTLGGGTIVDTELARVSLAVEKKSPLGLDTTSFYDVEKFYKPLESGRVVKGNPLIFDDVVRIPETSSMLTSKPILLSKSKEFTLFQEVPVVKNFPERKIGETTLTSFFPKSESIPKVVAEIERPIPKNVLLGKPLGKNTLIADYVEVEQGVVKSNEKQQQLLYFLDKKGSVQFTKPSLETMQDESDTMFNFRFRGQSKEFVNSEIAPNVNKNKNGLSFSFLSLAGKQRTTVLGGELIKTLSGQTKLFNDKVSLSQDLISSDIQKQESVQGLNLVLKRKLTNEMVSGLKIQPVQSLKQGLLSELVQKQESVQDKLFKFDIRTNSKYDFFKEYKYKQDNEVPPIKIELPSKQIDTFNFVDKKKKSKKDSGFVAFLKVKGKLRAVSPTVSKGAALDIGAAVAKRSLAATFTIKQVTGTPINVQTRGEFTRYQNEFRNYKVKQGRMIPLQDTYIQRRSFRLGTKSEVGAIQQAKKTKRWY